VHGTNPILRFRGLGAESFGAIERVEIEFGPGLNVLYGPNDLGKSTVAAAIRLGLLLPHGSSHAEDYVAWHGTGDPFVELTFETEAQRIWRVESDSGRAPRRSCASRGTGENSTMWSAGARWMGSSARF
jgi:recombinational DNA repair ATPase RecF